MKHFLLALVFCGIGCSAGAPGADDSNHFTITRVSVDASGAERVQTATVSRTEFARLHALEHNGAPVLEDYNAGQVTCSGTSVNLYDNTLAGCQTGCNEICFDETSCSNHPNVYLGGYCHTSSCTESWNGLVRSYYSGSNGDYLYRYYNDGYDGAQYFPASDYYGDADTYGRAANYLYFKGCLR